MGRASRTALGIFGALALVAILFPSGASAQKVANPGPFRMDITNVYMLINNGFEFSRFPPQDPGWSLEGQITEKGDVTIPSDGIHFAPMDLALRNPYDGSSVQMKAQALATGASTGTLDPISGATEIEMKLRVKISGTVWGNPLSDSCSIGADANPIVVRLTSGLTPPTQRFDSRSGMPYQGAYVGLTNSDFNVPSATGCLLGGWLDVNSFINDSQYLPSPRGQNLFEISGRITPQLNSGVVAKIQPTMNDELTGAAPFSVAFKGSGSTVTKGPARHSWSFGDGTTSTEADPTHIYERPGNYAARLTVTDADGDQAAVATRVIVVEGNTADPGPVARIGFRSPRMVPETAPRTLQFTAADSTVMDGPTTYEWDFGDGQRATGIQNDHTYTDPGSYNAVLNVTDAKGRVSTANMTIRVTPAFDPVARIVATSSSPTGPNPNLTGNTPLSVSFDGSSSTGANGPLSYSWDFGDGHSATGAKVTHTYTAAGQYKPRLMVTDGLGAIGTDVTFVSAVDPGGPAKSRDKVSISITGTNRYRNYELDGQTYGQFQIHSDGFGLLSVSGDVGVDSSAGGRAKVLVNVNRLWVLPSWAGEIRVVDPVAGVDVTTPVFGPVRFAELPGGEWSTAGSTINWFKLGTLVDPVQPYTLSWSATHAG